MTVEQWQAATEFMKQAGVFVGLLGVFVTGPLIMLIRAVKENTTDRARIALTGTSAVPANKVASEVVPEAPPAIPVTVVDAPAAAQTAPKPRKPR